MKLNRIPHLIFRIGIYTLIVFCLLKAESISAQPLAFDWQPGEASGKDCLCNMRISIINNVTEKSISDTVYRETQKLSITPHKPTRLKIGKGQTLIGNIDSLIWAEGAFLLEILPDTIQQGCNNLKYAGTIRIPSEIKPTNIEGTIDEKSIDPPGHLHIPINQNKRPKKVSVDLSTSYVNIGYPANTYPIYRHFEWYDADGDGKGSAFTMTYSDNTTHSFKENTNDMGEVRLYEQGAFQQLVIATSTTAVDILITKPVPVDSFSNTFTIKGPWKLTYYIEW